MRKLSDSNRQTRRRHTTPCRAHRSFYVSRRRGMACSYADVTLLAVGCAHFRRCRPPQSSPRVQFKHAVMENVSKLVNEIPIRGADKDQPSSNPHRTDKHDPLFMIPLQSQTYHEANERLHYR